MVVGAGSCGSSENFGAERRAFTWSPSSFPVLTSLPGRWECSALTFQVEKSGKGPHPEAVGLPLAPESSRLQEKGGSFVGILNSLRISAGNFS